MCPRERDADGRVNGAEDAAREREISALYRAASAGEVPSAATDDAVLATARDALAGASDGPPGRGRAPPGRARRRVPRRRRRATSLAVASLAAVAVLSAVVLQHSPRPGPSPPNGPARAAKAPAEAARESAGPALPQLPASELAAPHAYRQGTARDPFSADEAGLARRPGAPPPAPMSVGTPTPSATSPPRPSNDPAAWIAEIERLLAAGERDAARLGFYAFRERYPAHPVSDDLLQALGM